MYNVYVYKLLLLNNFNKICVHLIHLIWISAFRNHRGSTLQIYYSQEKEEKVLFRKNE